MEWASRRRPEFWENFRNEDGNLDIERRDMLLARFQSHRGPILAPRASDDQFATDSAMRSVRSLFANADWEEMVLVPKDLSLPRVGHFGYLRPDCGRTLWTLLARRIENRKCRQICNAATGFDFRDAVNGNPQLTHGGADEILDYLKGVVHIFIRRSAWRRAALHQVGQEGRLDVPTARLPNEKRAQELAPGVRAAP